MRAKATSIRNKSNISKTSRAVSNNNNRGDALAKKVQTVLGDLKSETGIKNLANIEKHHVSQLIESWREKVENNDVSEKTVTGYISALNQAVQYVDKANLTVKASEEGFRKHFEYVDRSVSEDTHQSFQKWLSEQYQMTGDLRYESLRHMSELQREVGCRFRESAQVKIATKDVRDKILYLKKTDGTKSGREREVGIRNDSQRNALENAQDFSRANGMRSLIPNHENYKDFKNFAYKALDQFRSTTGQHMEFHGERHTFAKTLYKELIDSGYKDYDARKIVSEELGHGAGRMDVLKHYLGPCK